MYKRPAIINNYRTSLFEEPIRGLRNLIAWPDNTGNILFLESIGSQINNCTPINIYADLIEHPQYFLENFDCLVLPMANMISNEWQCGEILDVLEAYSIPVILVSIGIQADNEKKLKDMELSRDARRLLYLAAMRSVSIGVRGEKTAIYLHDRGYENIDVIGCPSIFGPAIPITKKNIYKIATHCNLHGDWRERIQDLFVFSLKYAQGYVAQSELRLLVDRYDISDSDLAKWISNPERLKAAMLRGFECQYYSTDNNSVELRAWMKKNLVYFTDLDSWKAYLSNFDFVVGTRFHGSVMATLAGVPSLLLTTDLRVQELAEYHKLPHMPLEYMTSTTTPETLRSRVDYTEYQENMPKAKEGYRRFLVKNGLEPAD